MFAIVWLFDISIFIHIYYWAYKWSRILNRQEIGRGGGDMEENWWDQFEHFNHSSEHV